MRVNLDQIREVDPGWYQIASRASGKTEGEVDLDFDQLKFEKEPQIKMSEIDTELAKDLQRASDAQSAKNRLDQYVSEQNLEPSSDNLNVITIWLNENVRGYWSSAGVDAAVSCLGPKGTNVLVWGQAKVVAPPAPQPTGEVLGVLPSGEPQLPLDAPNHVIKHASVEQAKDYLKRSNQHQHQRGWFGSKL